MRAQGRQLFVVLGLLLLAAADSARAQIGSAQPQLGSERQLSFGVGPLRIAPYIRLGQIALDTNVFYTQEDRRTDVLTAGGPGLRISLPVRRLTLYADGSANYYWFARTVEQRRLGGTAGGGADWASGGFRAGVSRDYQRTFERPSVEVDRRVLQDGWRNRIYLGFGEEGGTRFKVRPSLLTERLEVAQGTRHLGADLSQALTEDRYLVAVEMSYRLTGKTSALVFVDQQWSRFPREKARDVDSNRLAAGFSVSSDTRVAGRVMGGVRLFRPKGIPEAKSFIDPYVEASLEWRVGPKTLLAAEYRRDTSSSVFTSISGDLPTVTTQIMGLRLNRRLARRIDLDLRGNLTIFQNDLPVLLERSGGLQTLARDDKAYMAYFDLGYSIRDRLRLGARATYVERQSNFADFGVDGLLVGASISFNP